LVAVKVVRVRRAACVNVEPEGHMPPPRSRSGRHLMSEFVCWVRAGLQGASTPASDAHN
jgi:hypothetical protein